MRSIETPVGNTELVARRRNEICEAAYRVFVSKGFHRSTMHQSAAVIGIGSRYGYIRGTEDLLDLICERNLRAADVRGPEGDAGRDRRHRRSRRATPQASPVEPRDHALPSGLPPAHVAGVARDAQGSLQHVFGVERARVSLYRSMLVAGVDRGVFEVADVDLAAVGTGVGHGSRTQRRVR